MDVATRALAILVAIGCGFGGGGAMAAPPVWRLVPEDSHLRFEYQLQGEAAQGRFRRFDGEIRFDPQDLAASSARIDIDLASVETGAADQTETLRSAAWFAVADHPTASFVSKAFKTLGKTLGGNQYEVTAELRIKGVSHEVAMPFTLDIENGEAHMTGALDLARLDYKLGEGWENPDYVGLKVRVLVDITARKKLEAH